MNRIIATLSLLILTACGPDVFEHTDAAPYDADPYDADAEADAEELPIIDNGMAYTVQGVPLVPDQYPYPIAENGALGVRQGIAVWNSAVGAELFVLDEPVDIITIQGAVEGGWASEADVLHDPSTGSISACHITVSGALQPGGSEATIALIRELGACLGLAYDDPGTGSLMERPLNVHAGTTAADVERVREALGLED